MHSKNRWDRLRVRFLIDLGVSVSLPRHSRTARLRTTLVGGNAIVSWRVVRHRVGAQTFSGFRWFGEQKSPLGWKIKRGSLLKFLAAENSSHVTFWLLERRVGCQGCSPNEVPGGTRSHFGSRFALSPRAVAVAARRRPCHGATNLAVARRISITKPLAEEARKQCERTGGVPSLAPT